MHLYDVIMCVAITLYTDMCSFLLGVRESLTTKMRNVFEVKFSKGTESLKSSIQQIEQRRNEDTLRLKGSVKVTSRGECEGVCVCVCVCVGGMSVSLVSHLQSLSLQAGLKDRIDQI